MQNFLYVQIDDMDVIEVQCIVANLIFEVSHLSGRFLVLLDI